MDEELLGLLLEHADQDNPDYAWRADVNNIAIRLTAASPKTLDDIDDAWRAAIALRDSIADLGYVIYGNSKLGVVAEHSYEGQPGKPGGWPITGWRGTVELTLGTRPMR